MPLDNYQYKGPFVLFGNGETPTHTTPIKILKSAVTILCTDGGADKLKSLGLQPNLILGDMDSLSLAHESYNCEIIKLMDQSKTDLEKSLEWCSENGIGELSLVGFSGGQDDHNMAALWTLVSFHEKMKLTLYSNSSKIKCVKSESRFDSFTGQTISIIPTKENIETSVSGLKYSINKSILKPPSFGTRNSANGDHFSIQSNGPVWVFLNYTI
jgi:thiamine pyrophosphokinase|tara:strand:+ start:493 stop:1131 length:639 start_codon:yes stop_codon:yes gene_type:complete